MTGPSYLQRQQTFETMLFEIINEHDIDSVAFKNANDFIFFIGQITNNIEYMSVAETHDTGLTNANLSEFGFSCLETLGYFNIQCQMPMPA